MATPIFYRGNFLKISETSDCDILVLQTYVFEVTESIGDVYFVIRASENGHIHF